MLFLGATKAIFHFIRIWNSLSLCTFTLPEIIFTLPEFKKSKYVKRIRETENFEHIAVFVALKTFLFQLKF